MATTSAAAPTCPTCGAPVAVGQATCQACGRSLPAATPDLHTPGPNQWYSERTASAPAAAATAGLFSDLPFVAPPLAVGWLVVAGAWASVLAFVLPWADASGLGYFDSWGLYKGSHVVVFLIALALALLVVLPVRLPPLIRLALLPLLLGAFEFGLVWEWLGSQAVGLGVWLLLLGAVLAVAGGVLVASRLVDPDRLS